MEQPMIKKQNSDGGDIVGFIDLPEEIVHRILLLLGAKMRDLARLSMVSKRCRELCISTPYLRLSNIDTGNKLKSFVDKFMALRCLHGVPTKQFQLCWSFDEDNEADEYRAVETWLQRAVASGGGVANVRLRFVHPRKASQSQSQSFALSLCVMRCNSLRFLEVDAENGVLKLPSPPYFATKLWVLRLSHVRIENDSNIGALFSSFKSLMQLWLDNVSGIKSMNISSSSLSFLSITSFDNHLCDIDIQLEEKLCSLLIHLYAKPSTAGGKRSLKISAPSLLHFHLSGFIVDHYCMRDSPRLQEAIIDLSHSSVWTVNQAAAYKNNLDKILHNVKKATYLTIRLRLFEVLNMQGFCLPFSSSFDNVECLTMEKTSITTGVHQVLPLSSLLRRTTNLKHLTICFDSGMSWREQQYSLKMEDWESQNLMFTHQLKKVIVKLCDGVKEIELIKYLLKNAQELQAMEILYTSPMSSDFIIDELTKYKKPSTRLCLYSTSSYILYVGRVLDWKMVDQLRGPCSSSEDG